MVERELDEAQVTVYVKDLLRRYNNLTRDQEHLASLRQLAETIVKEAARVAADVMQRAQREVQEEVVTIAARA